MDIAERLYNHFSRRRDYTTEYNLFNYYFDMIEPGSDPYSHIIFRDYFGIDLNKNLFIEEKERINILYYLYKVLIKQLNCNIDLLYKCFKFNKLDELIKTKFKYRSFGYFEEYISKNIIIGDTSNDSLFDNQGNLIDVNNQIIIKNFDILDGDHCPNCSVKGYITKQYGALECAYDCKKCFVPMCKNCAYIDNKEEPWSQICFSCCCEKSTGNLITNIKRKINSHKLFDKKRFGIEGNIDYKFITELIKKQDKKCFVCKEEVLLIDWKPYCCYQFSIDRINNEYSHNKDNVRITCYYCNCRHFPKFDQPNKICNQKCHIIKKNI